MAVKFSWLESFKEDPLLSNFYLEDVTATGNTLGQGSCGSVIEIKYGETVCAAKRIHDFIFQLGREEIKETIERYQKECQLMAGLRHPNITQFLGLCFLKGCELPLLVMEKLEMSVHDLLECAPNIPLPVKISILTDTCNGLLYLHSQDPPVIHRDLTARNVLLTSSLSAKISDLGNSRIIAGNPGQLAQTLTKNPGTSVYMPPEAIGKYGPSLDVFSFGHLSLFVLTQVCPGELLSSTHQDPTSHDKLIARSEVDCRQTYMTTLETMYARTHPLLLGLVKHCLHNTPERRPTSKDLLAMLCTVKLEVGVYGRSIIKQLDIASILHVKEVKEKDKKIKGLQVSKEKLVACHKELMTTVLLKDNEIQDLKQNLSKESKDDQKMLIKLENENSIMREALDSLEERNKILQESIKKLNHSLHEAQEKLKKEKQEHHQEIDKLKKDKEYQSKLLTEVFECLEKERDFNQDFKGQIEIYKQRLNLFSKTKEEGKIMTRATAAKTHCKINIIEKNNDKIRDLNQLDWRRGPDMPMAMSAYIQSVENNGIVYVGGGLTARSEDDYIIMAYNTESRNWYTLPSYHTRRFTMTIINEKLVLVGGADQDNSTSNEVGNWHPDRNQWTRPFPPMSIPRLCPSATFYKHWLFVVGGNSGRHGNCLNSVEVLDVDNKQWSNKSPIPTGWSSMKSTTIGDTWYLTGGYYEDMGYRPEVYCVSLRDLVVHSATDLWRELPSLNCTQSCLINVKGSLQAVGGRNIENYEAKSTIQCYDTDLNIWVNAGKLPLPLMDCTCIVTAEQLHIMGGWDGRIKHAESFTSVII